MTCPTGKPLAAIIIWRRRATDAASFPPSLGPLACAGSVTAPDLFLTLSGTNLAYRTALSRPEDERCGTSPSRFAPAHDWPGGALSGGEQQQLAVAKALLLEPKLLCIDEMSLGLAPVLVEQLLVILRDINASGVSILMVEQDVETALEFSARAYVLETGRIKLSGSAAMLLDDPEVQRAYLGV